MERKEKRVSVIVDSNILISYLAKDVRIRKFINENIHKLCLIVLDYTLEEINNFLEENEDYLKREERLRKY